MEKDMGMADQVIENLRDLISLLTDLFHRGRISSFLGYQKGTIKFKSAPLIARKAEDLRALNMDDFLYYNLTFYLKEIKGKVGLLVKGCDSRSLISLIKEGQVNREDLYIIGIPCPGQIDLKKIALLAGGEPEAIEEITRPEDGVLVRFHQQEQKFSKEQSLLDKCLTCFYPKPLLFDALLKGDYLPPVPPKKDLEDEAARKNSSEKWAFWSAQFARCLRCYACRNICPACYCPRCVVEENMPEWISPVPTPGDNFVFHLMRLMHVAGTCTSCGECERVCPVEIPLMKLNEKMARDLKELFAFEAGVDLEKPLPFRTYRQEDPNEFIK